MAPPIRTRPSFPLSQSLPSGSFHKALIRLHQKAHTENHNHRKLTNLIRGPQPCLTLSNYGPCHIGPLKADISWWRVLKNMVHWRREWQTTSIFLPWEPMNSMTRQKDRTLNDELPRLVGTQYDTGNQLRNNSRKNEETEPKQNQHPVVDVTGDRSNVQFCK